MTPERQFPLKWPAGWPRIRNQIRSQFSTGMDKAVRGLLREIQLMGGSLPVISSNAQYRQDGMPYARQGALDDTGVAVYFQRKGKPMVIACDTFGSLHENIHAVSRTIEALRAVERYGASSMERAFQGFTALPAPIVAGMSRPWRVVLGLEGVPQPTPADIGRAFRRLASLHHTDKPGGDHHKMAELNAARDAALQELS